MKNNNRKSLRNRLILQQGELALTGLAAVIPLMLAMGYRDVNMLCYAFLIMGVVALAGGIIHAAVTHDRFRHTQRRNYEYALAGVLAFTLLCVFSMYLLLLFVIIIPGITIWHFIICYQEMTMIAAAIENQQTDDPQ